MSTASPDFRQALDAPEDAVAIIDGQGTIVAANVEWRRFVADNGGDADGDLGRNHLDDSFTTCNRAAGRWAAARPTR